MSSTSSICEGNLTLKVSRSKWPKQPEQPEWEELDAWFSDRTISFSIDTAEGRVVAGGHLTEWRSNSDFDRFLPDDLESFCEAANFVGTRSTLETAEVMLRAWPDAEIGDAPFRYGNLLIFDRLRIEAANMAESALAWGLIGRMFKRWRKLSLIVLKAFPLKYEGRLEDGDTKARAAFHSKRAAMIRLYVKRLGVSPFPGKDGDDGFMWRAFSYPYPPSAPRN